MIYRTFYSGEYNSLLYTKFFVFNTWTTGLHARWLSAVLRLILKCLTHTGTSHCRWKAENCRPLSREGDLLCHNCIDTGPRFNTVPSEGLSCLVASYDKSGVLRTYNSNLIPTEYGLRDIKDSRKKENWQVYLIGKFSIWCTKI